MSDREGDADCLERIAWRVLADLCQPDGVFAAYPPHALRRLIAWRLAKEAKQASVSLEALSRVFERAARELTGADRPPPSSDE